MPPWVMGPIAAAAVAGSLALHRGTIGFLPEDPPGKGRKNHSRPTPLVGAAIAPLLVVWLLFHQAWWLAAATLLAALVGGWDDARKVDGKELGWRFKALGLIAAAGLGALECGSDTASLAPWEWLALGSLLFVTTNALNFLDNTDGVAAALAGVGLAATGGDLAAGGFVALGVLPFNWPRAAVFLGDGLALPLGLWLGVTALTGGGFELREPHWCAPCILAPIAVLALDFTQVVSARLYLGIAPWIGDRRHLTHISMLLGLPRTWVAPVFAIAAAAAYWLLSNSTS